MEKGQRLGSYEIIGLIGSGGMGDVYKARDTRLDRIVAIKLVKGQFSDRFEREARAISSLNHPCICTLYDVGPDYLVMEFIDGAPVRGPLPLDQSLKVAVQIAGALDAAHRKGIIHRDLKPANILVNKSGVKLLDFGLAKQEFAFRAAATEDTLTQAQTQQGAIVGTMQYMSPEQIQGLEADVRSDIFSFGLVFYELLTGHRAFTAGNSASLIAAILTAQPEPLTTLLPALPPAVDRVVQRALAKDPDDRWQSARDLMAELEWLSGSSAALEKPSVPGSRRSTRRPGLLGWLVAAALALAGSALAWVHWTEKPTPMPLARFAVDPPPGEKFFPGTWPSVSPDGQRVLFAVVSHSSGQPALWVYRVPTGESAPIPSLGYRPGQDGAWSPDSNSFALARQDSLQRVDVASGAQTEILHETVSDFAWGPAGSYLFGRRDKGLFWAGPAGRKQVTVQKGDEGFHTNPQILPGGKYFLFEKQRSQVVETWIARLDGSDQKLLLTTSSQVYCAPPGYLLYLQGDSLLAQSFDAARGTVTGDPHTLVTGVARSPASTWGLFSVSQTNVLVFRQGSVTNPARMTWLDRNGKVLGTLGDIADFSNPALSPDGGRLAVCIRDSTGKRDVWAIDIVRGFKTRLTFDPADETNPAWSPDGSEIAYSSDRHGHRDIYSRSSSGTGQERVLLESAEDKTVLDWSADGKFLVYSVQDPRTRRDLWLLPMTGNDRRPSLFLGTPFQEDFAVVSPDSRHLLYRSNENGTVQLYLQPLPPDGRKWPISNSNSPAAEAAWQADGREIFYISGGDFLSADVPTEKLPLNTVPPRKLFPVPFRTVVGRNRFVASRDGQRFLFFLPEAERDEALTPFVVILNWPRLLENR